MPLSEIVFDFYDRLKSVSRGYASFDYAPIDIKVRFNQARYSIQFRPSRCFISLVHRSNAFSLGKKICLKLKELIPRQQFEIPIQAAIGAKIVKKQSKRFVKM